MIGSAVEETLAASVIYERARNLLEGRIGDELVALDHQMGKCFGFDAVAARVWDLLDRPSTFRQMHAALIAEYDVDPTQCTYELLELLDEMQQLGLIRRGRSSTG